ncbi:glucoside xylosyltransferase 1-like [Saccostrea cucullata]|uniref:glucoside xylosyltransferase 1-like n=1 Tax=Saccostrea cuccullata TaxID=36930 RepID=UPI002ED44C6D
MLMNLTRLRNSTWLPSIVNYYKEYKLKITWGDQDLINIYFHFHPDELYVYPCEWNYRPDHCMYMSVCTGAERSGAYVLHGNRRAMQNDKQPAFKAAYLAFKEYDFHQKMKTSLLPLFKRNLRRHPRRHVDVLDIYFQPELLNLLIMLKNDSLDSEEMVARLAVITDFLNFEKKDSMI